MNIYYITCRIPIGTRGYNSSYSIRNKIECLVSSNKLYNGQHYYCKMNSIRISRNKFYFVSSHMANKIIYTIRQNFPEIEITIDRKLDWKY